MSKYTFKSLDRTGVIKCDNLDLVRPFKVKREIKFENRPTVVNTTYHVRLCSADTTTEQLYHELDKAMEISEKTYNRIIGLKQVWCEHQVLTGKISPFVVTPGTIPERRGQVMKPLIVGKIMSVHEVLANCRKDPEKYGSPVMFEFILGTGVELSKSMFGAVRVGVKVFGRNKDSNYDDIGCVCMDHCRFYIINNRVDSRSPSFTYVRDVIIPKLHKSDKTSSKCFVMPLWGDQFSSKNVKAQDWLVTCIQDQYRMYKSELAKRKQK